MARTRQASADRVQLHHAGAYELPLPDDSVDLAVLDLHPGRDPRQAGCALRVAARAQTGRRAWASARSCSIRPTCCRAACAAGRKKPASASWPRPVRPSAITWSLSTPSNQLTAPARPVASCRQRTVELSARFRLPEPVRVQLWNLPSCDKLYIHATMLNVDLDRHCPMSRLSCRVSAARCVPLPEDFIVEEVGLYEAAGRWSASVREPYQGRV